MSDIGDQVLDLSVLGMLPREDPNLFASLMSDFLINAGGYVRELAGLAETQSWCDLAHKLKGAAQSVGAISVSRVAREAEATFPETAEERAALIAELDAELARVASLLEGAA
jgi:HPt (histidine-containing phosphotransfer) domain-containing protein